MIWHSMQIVSIGDNLQEMSKPDFWEKNKKNITKCCLLKILSRILSVESLQERSFRCFTFGTSISSNFRFIKFFFLQLIAAWIAIGVPKYIQPT